MSNIIVPSCPKDRKEIKDVIEQISNSMARIESEKEYQKEAYKELSERFEVDQKWLKKMAADYHKDTYKKTVGDFEDYSLLYENIMQTSGSEETEEHEETV